MGRECLQFGRGLCQKDATTNICDGLLCRSNLRDNRAGCVIVDAWFYQGAGVLGHTIKGLGRDDFAENIHRDVDQNRPRLAAFCQVKCLLKNFCHKVRAVHSPCAFHEGTIDFPLGRVGVQVDLLVRMLTVIMRRDIARDDDHRDAIKGGICHARGAVCEAGGEVA